MLHEQSIRKLKQRLQTHFGAKLQQVLVFGSVARGTSRPTSDIDVFVILDDTMHELTWRMAAEVRTVIYPIELEDEVVFDLKVMGKTALQGIAGHTPFVETVMKEGVRV